MPDIIQKKISEFTSIDVVTAADVLLVNDVGTTVVTKQATMLQLKTYTQAGYSTTVEAAAITAAAISSALASYSTTSAMNAAITASVTATINSALANYTTTAAMNAAITAGVSAAMAGYPTTSAMNAAIASALSGYSTTAAMNAAITSALGSYSTTAAMNAAISSAVSGKQDTLIAGTNIKTINGVSPLGSGNIVVSGGGSGAPGGGDTEIQFNAAGSLGGSSKLTWGGTTLGIRSPGVLLRLDPPTGVTYARNAGFNLGTSVTAAQIGSPHASVSAINYTAFFGFNLAPGGGSIDPTLPGIGDAYESNYITNRRGFNEVLVERHQFFMPQLTTANTVAGSQIRLSSYEVLTGQSATTGAIGSPGLAMSASYYMSVNSFDIRLPADGNQGTVYYRVAPGELLINSPTTGEQLTIACGGAYIQYSAAGGATHLFSNTIGVSGDISATGKLAVQSVANDSFATSGGIACAKDITCLATKNYHSVQIFEYDAFAVVTEPAAVSAGAVLFLEEVTGVQTAKLKFANGTVKTLANNSGSGGSAISGSSLTLADLTATHQLIIDPSGGYINFTHSHVCLFGGDVFTQGTLGSLGAFTSQSTSADSILSWGGIRSSTDMLAGRHLIATQSAMVNNSLDIFDYSIYGTPTTEPAVVAGAVRLISNVESGSQKFKIKFSNGQVKELANDAAVTLPRPYPVVVESTTSRTLGLADAFRYLRCSNAAATSITVAPQADVAWAADTETLIEQAGTGQVTIVPGAGVTLRTSLTLKSNARYAVMTLKRVASNEWVVGGDRSAS